MRGNNNLAEGPGFFLNKGRNMHKKFSLHITYYYMHNTELYIIYFVTCTSTQ